MYSTLRLEPFGKLKRQSLSVADDDGHNKHSHNYESIQSCICHGQHNRLFLIDNETNSRFLVDPGADVSVIPPKFTDKKNVSKTKFLSILILYQKLYYQLKINVLQEFQLFVNRKLTSQFKIL